MNQLPLRERQLVQLLQLQQTRITAAEAEYRVCVTECKTLLAAMDKRQTRIKELRNQSDALKKYGINHNASELVKFSENISARQNWLDHNLERDEYWLKDDIRELKEAEAQVDKTKQRWLQSRSKEVGIQSLLKKARCNHHRAIENKLETEAEDLMSFETRSV